MEKTLSMGAFTELDEKEMMETEGGLLGIIIVAAASTAFAGVCAYGYNTVHNMNKVGEVLPTLESEETTTVTMKTMFGKSYDVTVTAGTKYGSYYDEASKLFLD